MNEPMEKPFALPIAGPVLVLVLVLLVALWAPVSVKPREQARILDSAGRIGALSDAELAGRPRVLSPDFSPEVSLSFKEAMAFDDQWETYPFFGGRSFAPRRPDEILSAFRDQKNLTADQIRLLLDTILTSRSPEDAVGAMNLYLIHHPDDPEIRLFAADFFLDRLLPKRAGAMMNERFHLLLDQMKKTTDQTEKIALSRKADECIDRLDEILGAYRIDGNTDKMTRRLIDACPENESLLFDCIDRLIVDKKYDSALEMLLTHEGRYDDKAAKITDIKARILEGQGRIEQAISLYEDHPKLFDGSLSLFSDFLSLLARTHRTDSWRKSLIQKTAEGFDLPALKRLFHYYMAEGDTRLLVEQLDMAEQHAKHQQIQPSDLKEMADLGLLAGSRRLVARAVLYRWNLLVLADSPSEQQEAAIALAEALVLSDAPPPFPVSQSLAGAADPGFLDRYPGLAGGVLSLDLNLRGTRSRFAALKDAGNQYENMRLALNLALPHFSPDAPPVLASKALHVLETVYSRIGLEDRYVQTLVRYLQFFPDAKDAPDALWKLADHARIHKDIPSEDRYLRQLLEMAQGRKDGPLMDRVRKRIVQRLVEQKRFTEVLPFYWDQVESQQDNEKLLLEFIDFCKRYNIFEDAVRAYELAARRFNRMAYSDQLATYLLSQKRRDAFEALTATLADTLDRADLEDYLNRRVFYGKWNSAESAFFERMYQTALARFPHQRHFLDRLLNLYAQYERDAPDARRLRTELLVKYFAIDPALGRELCAELAAQQKLDAAIDQVLQNREQNPVEMRFLSEALGFQSRFETQYAVLKVLEKEYAEVALTEQTASLERSLDESFYGSDPQMTESSAMRYAGLADRYPTRIDFATRAGEVYIEAGRQRSAAAIWESMLQYEPGRPHAYLDLATLYWDYYLFEHALGVIEEGRTINRDPFMLAKEAGYLHESMDRQDLALVEYVHLICNSEGTDWEVEERVHRIEGDASKKAAIDKAFDHYLERPEARPEEVLKYGDYLGNYDRRDRKTEVFKKFMDRFDDESFLVSISDYFSGMGHGDLAEQALERLADASGRNTDVLLRLLAFYETHDRKKEIVSICDELEQANGPDSLRHREVMQRIAQARWDAGDRTGALASYRKLADSTKGKERERNLFAYAQRCLDAGEETIGERILHDLATANPADSRYTLTLAEHYAEKDRYENLISLYREAIDQTRKASLFQLEKEERIVSFRRDLADALIRLERYTEALDQYIEVVNLRAPDRELTDEVYRYAQGRGQTGRLISYYEKLAAESHKDYRWQVVLAELYEMLGEPEKAADQYERAIRNEPQRLVLYDSWARALENRGDLPGALKALERRYELSGTEDDLRKVIEFAFRSGNREQGRELMLKQVEDPGTPAWRLFAAAEVFETYQERELAEQLLFRAVQRFREDPLKMDFSAEKMATVAKVIASRKGFSEGYRFLDDLRQWLLEKSNQADGIARDHLKGKMGQAESAMKYDYARYLHDYAPPDEYQSIESMLIEKVNRSVTREAMTTIGGQRVGDLARLYLEMAENGRMASLKRATLDAKAGAYRFYEGNPSATYTYRREADRVFGEYRKLGDPILNLQELARHSYVRDYPTDYRRAFARTAFLAGDRKLEKEALSLLFASGNDRGFIQPDSYEQRYLDILMEEDRPALMDLIQKTHRPGLLTGYLLWRGDSNLASHLLDLHWKKEIPSWHDRRKIQVLEYADRLAEAGSLYERILGLPRLVETQLDGAIDPRIELTEQRWFFWAFRFGKLLARLKDDRSEGYLIALAESKPHDAGSYLAMADVQGDHGLWQQAQDSIALAVQLSPKSESVLQAEGDLLMKRNQRAKAAQAYRRLIETRGESWRTYRTYYEWMKKAEMGLEALDSYVAFARQHLKSLGPWAQREQIEFLAEETGRGPRTTKLLKSILQDFSGEIHLFEAVIDGELVPRSDQGWFLATAADGILGMAGYSNYTKQDWQRRVFEHALAEQDKGLGQRALAGLDRLETSSYDKRHHRVMAAELSLVCDPGESGATALFALADECKELDCFQELHQLAMNHEKNRAADEILYGQLTFELKSGSIPLHNRILLARLSFERGRADQAESLLDYAASQSDGWIGQLGQIAGIYIDYGKSEKALKILEPAVTRYPENEELLLLQAVALACLPGRASEGARKWSDAFGAGLVSRSHVAGRIADAFKKLKANDALASFQGAVADSKDEGTALLAAEIHLREGKGALAREVLEKVALPRRYQDEYYQGMARACRMEKDGEGEVRFLTLAIERNPDRKDLIADRFFAWIKLGMTLRALDSIELWLPSNRYDLVEPLSQRAASASIDSFPGELGLGDEDADRLLSNVADALIVVDRPAEAKAYLQALRDRMKNEAGKETIEARIMDLEKKLQALREHRKPWPTLTND